MFFKTPIGSASVTWNAREFEVVPTPSLLRLDLIYLAF